MKIRPDQVLPPGEVDHDAPSSDHLGDRNELSDPYPLTRAAHSPALRKVPGDVHADPEQVRQDMGAYAAAPWKAGTQVRPIVPAGWFPFGRLLADGAQRFWLVEEDPQRQRVTIYNHATGAIWLAPTASSSPGAGALYVPGYDAAVGVVHSREIRSWARVYLFTIDGFVAGTEPVHVQVITERWGNE